MVVGVHLFVAGISALPKLIDLSSEESDRVQAATSLNNMIDGMQGSSKPMFSVLRVFRETLDKVKDISRDLRPVLASLQESCEVILELEPIFDSWSSIKVNSQ